MKQTMQVTQIMKHKKCKSPLLNREFIMFLLPLKRKIKALLKKLKIKGNTKSQLQHK